MMNRLLFFKISLSLALFLFIKVAEAQQSVLFDVTSIPRLDERVFFTYHLLNDSRFVVVNSEKEGVFAISASDGFEDMDLTEAFADFQEQSAEAFNKMDKTEAAKIVQQYKDKLQNDIVLSLMMDYYVESRQNNHCASSERYCSEDQYLFPAAIDGSSGENGPDYNCLAVVRNPSWYYMRISSPGSLDIHIYSEPSHDIDFCCWGPFDDPISPCPYGLTADKVVSCSYTTSWSENCIIPTTAQAGEYYILVITNYSSVNCNIYINQEGGEGAADCSLLIEALAYPDEGGVVSGSGSYEIGETCTLTAQANFGFTFIKWTENDELVSTSANYEFTVDRERTLVAHFTASPYVVNATVEPEGAGIVSGIGGFEYGENCTLLAEANTGYTFEKWTEDGNTVSTSASYSFDVIESRNLVAHFKANTYSIITSVDPPSTGVVTGSGIYEYNQRCTLSAISNSGYEFVNWTEDDIPVSTLTNYVFFVTEDRDLVAHFQQQNYNIHVSANPSNGGIVSGGGSFVYGQTCTLSATPATGFVFMNWLENGSEVSMDANYTFVVTGNRSLVARFRVIDGSLNGTFSVRGNSKVRFSQGNLQYNPGSDTWQFAENQYDHVGASNLNISPNYDGWIDLFGWGTSGYYTGYECYQPWSTSTNYEDYCANSVLQGISDWGYNRIVNGGYEYNLWKTLSSEDWDYMLHWRNTQSGTRFAKGCVNSINGLILLPDLWDNSLFALHNINNDQADFGSNVISISDWSILQNHGAVFLPAAGYRKKTTIQQMNQAGDYWTSSNKDHIFARCLRFNEDYGQIESLGRYYGCSVRLVKVVHPSSIETVETEIKVYPNPTSGRVVVEAESMSHIRIVNLIGQLVYESDTRGDRFEYDFRNKGAGLYFFLIRTKDSVVVKRVVLE